ncbi:MAG: transcriptional regulator [Herbinix sp.]|jgi:DNA-binding MarR family transcriptional regulator|nr:transcriptional regulator [Herbinix sp.]
MEDKSIGRLVSILYRQSQVYINHALKDLNISSSEYIFLMALYTNEGCSQEKLSSLLHIDKAATARAIKSLEEKGLVLRVNDENDKRAYKVFVTENGQSCRGIIYATLKGWTNLLTDGMDEVTINIVFDALQSMTEKLQNTDYTESSADSGGNAEENR